MKDVKQRSAQSWHLNALFLIILALSLLAPLAAAAAPNIVFLIAEDEYSANETLPKFARQLEEAYGFTCTILQGGDNDIPGTEALKKADLAVIYIRRKVLPESQMKHIRNYITAGKPVVGIRTASHAFSLRREEPGPGFFDWPEFDRDVLGGNYQGHTGHKGDEEVITYVRAVKEARSHPILIGVPKDEFAVPSWLYKTSPLAKTATPLMIGRVTGMDVEEPVTWINTSIYGGRVFYTSLGHPDEFEMIAFNTLLTNGIFWALGMPSPKAEKVSDPFNSGGIYIRIRPLSNRGQRSEPARWDPVDYNAQQILAMIEDFKPSVLERYTDGRLDAGALVPVAKGKPPMTVLQFLDASVEAGAADCQITPRVSLWEYDKGTLFQTAQSLYDLPLARPMRIISLDNWSAFAREHTEKQVRKMFEKIKAQGWHHIAVNMVGGLRDPLGYAAIAEFGIKKDLNFAPDFDKLERMKALGTIKKHLLYIDFPLQTADFMELSPDKRADLLTKSYGDRQKAKGFTFVWPIVQGKWDSKKVKTSPQGPYKGKTLYEVMKNATTNTGNP